MQNETPKLPLHVQLIQMGTAYWVSSLVYVAAKFSLADHLAKGPATAEDLAGATGTHAPTLYRVLRTLASLGIFTEGDGHKFSLTPLGEALKTGAPGSARATILTLGGEWAVQGWANLSYSVETGKSAVEKNLGMPVFDWLGQNPEMGSLFNETMIGVHGGEPPAVAKAYDFSGLNTIIDVGGGSGNLLTTILAHNPKLVGILYDLPQVAADAANLIELRGLTDRVRIETGSFFEKVPAGGDAYILSHIIHDWSESQCLTILNNLKHAMTPDSRLLIVEMVLPTGDTPHLGKLLDMMMLVGPGGRERTEGEYAILLSKAGFRLERVVPTESAVSVVEGRLAV